jgi:membrane protein CcdC involved in cytochrome C biogenesis
MSMVTLPPISSVFAKAAGSLLAAGAGAVVIIVWRLREARTAVSLRKIIIPPLGMATGFSAGVFFILAFGMIVIWRAKMLVDFRRLTADPEASTA